MSRSTIVRASLRRARLALPVLLATLALAPVGVAAAASWTVRFEPGTTAAEHARVLARHGLGAGEAVGAFHAWTVDIPGDATGVTAGLRAEPSIRYVEPARLARGLAFQPSDPLYTLNDAAGAGAWQLPRIHAQEAWNTDATGGFTGRGVIVAVVDTGVDASHPDLAGRVLPGFNAVTRKLDTDTSLATADYVGHGTAVSSVIAATASNGIDTVGVAPQALILPVKVMDAIDEFGGEAAADIGDEVRGVKWAADHGAKVINLSLGGDDTSRLEREGIDYARRKGAVLTCSAGNDGVGHIGFPARFDSCIAVGATSRRGGLTSFSQFGPGTDLVAPGEHIPVALPNYIAKRGFAYWDGTSFSAPVVAGVAALLAGRGMNADQVTDALESTATDLGAPGVDQKFGHGLVNAQAAVASAPAPAPHPADAGPTCPSFSGLRAVNTNPAQTTQVPIVCTDPEAEPVASTGVTTPTPTPAGTQVVPTADMAFTGTAFFTPPAGFISEAVATSGSDGVEAGPPGSLELTSPARRLNKAAAKHLVYGATVAYSKHAHQGKVHDVYGTCSPLSAVRWLCVNYEFQNASAQYFGKAVVTVFRYQGKEFFTVLFFGDKATTRCLATPDPARCSQPAFWRY